MIAAASLMPPPLPPLRHFTSMATPDAAADASSPLPSFHSPIPESFLAGTIVSASRRIYTANVSHMMHFEAETGLLRGLYGMSQL
jgi:hypothetical protein